MPRNKSQALLRWLQTGPTSLTWRILAVNSIALALLAGGFFYIDSYRTRIVDTRLQQSGQIMALLAASLDAGADDPHRLISTYARRTHARIRLYGPDGQMEIDSDRDSNSPPAYQLTRPQDELWKAKAARLLDKIVDRIVGARHLPAFLEARPDTALSWPELREAARRNTPAAIARYAPDRTLMISAGTRSQRGFYVLSTQNAVDITRDVRTERFYLALILAAAGIACITLSIFLGRTIVQPLRKLARAAVSVRLGRSREVMIPRLPDRRDEIGTLARALSDMTHALRQRIDATDAFAADVSHELKNPIASLRSALEGLGTVAQPKLKDQLLAIAREDVQRLDRLVTDIAIASRIDAQLSRSHFQPVDIASMAEMIILARESRGIDNDVRLAFARTRKDVAVTMGEPQRLEMVIENLLNNAISFSPKGGLVQISTNILDNEVLLAIEDEGPGIPPDERKNIFRRFHSIRPSSEEFGKHSGLGLAIARSIVDGHQGRIRATGRKDARSGARFEIFLPLAPGRSAETTEH